MPIRVAAVAVLLAACMSGPPALAETPAAPPPPAGATGTASPPTGAALVPEKERTNVNSAVGGTGELPNSGSVSGGEDPGGSPTNCMAGDSRPQCADKTKP
jgi:hypothetical protein